jgi:hypothetical protein
LTLSWVVAFKSISGIWQPYQLVGRERAAKDALQHGLQSKFLR